MGDAADDAFHSAADQEAEFELAVANLRRDCEHAPCSGAINYLGEGAFQCVSCGREFEL